MPVDFDDYALDYKGQVDRSISFVGKDVDFFAQAKVRHLLLLVRSVLGDPSNLSALDVGCGTGLFDKHLVSEFGSLCGIDTAAASIAEAAAANPGVSYSAYKGTRLPYSDDTFDITFAINVLHHVPPYSWHNFVAEMTRVTRPGGLVVIFEQNPINPLTRLAVDRCPFDADAVLLGRERALELLAGCGLVPYRQSFVIFFPWRNRITDALESMLSRLPLGAQYYVSGIKAQQLTGRNYRSAPARQAQDETEEGNHEI